jgi:hypothetical protein
LLREVPRNKWRDLMLARRTFLDTNLSADCRRLVEFCNDAEIMHAECGFASAEDMIRDGYGLQPDEIALVVRWLELKPPHGEPIPLEQAKRLARQEQAQQAEAEDKLNRREAGSHGRGRPLDVATKTDDVNVYRRPTGNTRAAALRRLLKHRPDIHARVLAGEITANAGMIEAGFRKPQPSRKKSAFQKIQELLPQLSAAELDALANLIRKAA